MKITGVTITGADNQVDFSELLDLQMTYPFVEWAILFSLNKEGRPRYPDRRHIKTFKAPLNLAAHFCGWFAKEVMENQNFDVFKSISDDFRRVQINYNFKDSSGWNLQKLLDFAQTQDRQIILQHNKSNSPTIDLILPHQKNIQVLFDASCGRGTEIQTIPEPLTFPTGYAGGISPDNIQAICEAIQAHPSQDSVWIDMESGVRTNNRFMFKKVEQVLDITSKFI